MFRSEEKTKDSVVTVIGPSVKVEGDLATEGDVVVEGTVIGSLKTEKNLKVGEQARIFAAVQATNALVAGEIQGNLKVKERLELTATAKIFGDIKTKTIIVASGAILNGKCVMEERKGKSEKPETLRQEKIELAENIVETGKTKKNS
jgi:cytoskeletal protein CcmA (bactofilin family)